MPGGSPGPQERGTYQRVLVNVGEADWTVGTDIEEPSLATALVASGQDEKILWARYHAWIYDSTVMTITEWMCIKCLATDALQDLNNSGDIELLLKRGRILKRGYVLSSGAAYAKLGQVKFEIYNVELNDGEELRLVFRPVMNAGANTTVQGELEYRFAGK